MGVVPKIRRILPERFKDLDWMPRLSAPLNIFMEEVIRLFNKDLRFNDNFDGELKQFSANGEYPIKLSWGRARKPVAVWIGRVNRSDGSTITYTVAPHLVWRFNENAQIQIDDIIGLDDTNSMKYNIVIIGVTG